MDQHCCQAFESPSVGNAVLVLLVSDTRELGAEVRCCPTDRSDSVRSSQWLPRVARVYATSVRYLLAARESFALDRPFEIGRAHDRTAVSWRRIDRADTGHCKAHPGDRNLAS